MKILIIQKKFMGDVLVTSAILPIIKKKYPNSEISFLLEEKHAQILKENPYVDHFLFFRKEGLMKTISDIKKMKFDIVIDFYSKPETGLIALLSGAKKRIGFYKKYTQFFYTSPVKRDKIVKSKNTTLAIEHRLLLLEPLGISFEEIFPKIFLSQEELSNAKQILLDNNLSTDDDLVMMSTFGSSPEKTYPIEYMAEVLEYIVEYKPNSKILCNYLPSQKDLFNELLVLLSDKTKQNIIKDFDTKNLREFAAVTSLCKCLIGNEGGATNVSKALGIPTFTIFSPHIQVSDWAWTSASEMDRFLHVLDFDTTSKGYSDFKPSFFKRSIVEFLDKTLK